MIYLHSESSLILKMENNFTAADQKRKTNKYCFDEMHFLPCGALLSKIVGTIIPHFIKIFITSIVFNCIVVELINWLSRFLLTDLKLAILGVFLYRIFFLKL